MTLCDDVILKACLLLKGLYPNLNILEGNVLLISFVVVGRRSLLGPPRTNEVRSGKHAPQVCAKHGATRAVPSTRHLRVGKIDFQGVNAQEVVQAPHLQVKRKKSMEARK